MPADYKCGRPACLCGAANSPGPALTSSDLLATKGVKIISVSEGYLDLPVVSPGGITSMCALLGSSSWARLQRKFRCRHCGSSEGYASRPRNWVERFVLPVFGMCPARCGDCYRRSWRRASVPLHPRKQPMHFEAEAMVASARAADSGEAQKETLVQSKERRRIA
jgi:hypothetical protein